MARQTKGSASCTGSFLAKQIISDIQDRTANKLITEHTANKVITEWSVYIHIFLHINNAKTQKYIAVSHVETRVSTKSSTP